MKPKVALILVAWALLLGMLAMANPASAHEAGHQSAAQRCFEHHNFGAQPVDVAKTADGSAVLAQTSWNWHDAIGCYLSLDQQALATLRAAPPPQNLPNAPSDASKMCFEHHKFGEYPVDVAKTTDGQTVLARLSWGYHNSIGCYLTLDNNALTTLRAAHTTDATDQADTDATTTSVATSNHRLIAAGGSHSCAIKTDDTIACWGSNQYHQSDPRTARYATIADFNGLRTARYTAVAAGGFHSCAIKTDQTITCWGSNSQHQSEPYTGRYTAIAAGGSHTCAIKTDGAIACWGKNWDGQTDAPAGRYTAIAAGGHSSCAINTTGAITCWGDNVFTQLESPDSRYNAIAAGGDHMCAINTASTVVCGGIDSPGIGQTDAPSGHYITISAGGDHSCAINTVGAIACWGSNDERQTDAPSGRYAAIAAGEDHTCAISTVGAIACWGDNQRGQTDAPSGRYTAIAAGFAHSCAINTAGAIACWGSNDEGQANTPAGRYTAITANWGHTCAIKTDQTIACWGYNYRGWSDPPGGRFIAVAAGAYHSCAIRTDQTIACWGNNQDGQTEAPPGRFTAITAGSYHTCAIGVDTRMACWGYGGLGPTYRPSRLFRSPRGNITVDIHICTTAELRSTISAQFMDDVVGVLNEQLAPIYGWESSSNLSVRFKAGQVFETSFTDGRPFACIAQEQRSRFKSSLHRTPISIPHFINHTGVHFLFDGVSAGSGFADGLLSVTNVRPRNLLSSLTEGELHTLQHELDHAMLGVIHINVKRIGPNRLDPSVTSSIGQNLGQLSPSLSTLFPDALTCYDKIRLGWPVGDSSPVCPLISPAAPTDLNFEETVTGDIVLRWPKFYHPSNRRLATVYKVQVQTYKGEIILTREVSIDTTQLQLPRLPPGEYSIWLSTESSEGDSLFPSSVYLIVDPQ